MSWILIFTGTQSIFRKPHGPQHNAGHTASTCWFHKESGWVLYNVALLADDWALHNSASTSAKSLTLPGLL